MRLAEDTRFAQLAAPHGRAVSTRRVILENDQNYRKASDLFKKYAADKRSSARTRRRRSSARRSISRSSKTGIKHDQDVQRLRQDLRQRSAKARIACSRPTSASATAYEAQARQAGGARHLYKKIVAQGASAAPGSEQAEYPGARGVHLDRAEAAARREGVRSPAAASSWRPRSRASRTTSATWSSEYNKVLAYQRARLDPGRLFPHRLPVTSCSRRRCSNAPCPPEVKKLGRGGVRHLPRSDRTDGGGR